jgi:hypothetical protein
MTHGRSLAATAVLAALLAAGCGGGSASQDAAEKPAKLDARPSGAPATPKVAAPAETAAAAGTDADLSALEDIPTTEQLEQHLSESVTDQNADAEFEKLQKELESEDEGG